VNFNLSYRLSRLWLAISFKIPVTVNLETRVASVTEIRLEVVLRETMLQVEEEITYAFNSETMAVVNSARHADLSIQVLPAWEVVRLRIVVVKVHATNFKKKGPALSGTNVALTTAKAKVKVKVKSIICHSSHVEVLVAEVLVAEVLVAEVLVVG